MLRPAPMKKVAIIGDEAHEEEIIKALQELGLVHITRATFPGLKEEHALEKYGAVSEALLELRGAIKVLEEVGIAGEVKDLTIEEVENALKKFETLKPLIQKLEELAEDKKRLESKLIDLKHKKAQLTQLLALGKIDFRKLKTKHFTYVIVALPKKQSKTFEKEVHEFLGKKFAMRKADEKNKTLFLIIYPANKNIEPLLAKFGAERIRLPEDLGYAQEELEKLEKEKQRLEEELAHAEKELHALAEKKGKELFELEFALSALAEQATIALKFQRSANIFVCTGWVEKEKFEFLREKLKEKFGSSVEILSVKTHETPPVILHNPKIMKPFEYLATFLALPGKYDIDPTILFFIGLPIMYGMIVGDVGYAVISAIIARALIGRFKDEMIDNIAKIWYYSSVAAAAWGVVFDEWFGMSHVELLKHLHEFGIPVPVVHLYHGISRTHSLPIVLGITLVIGLLHMILAYLVGAYVEWKHDKKHAIGKIAWAGVAVAGSVAVSWFMFNLVPPLIGKAAALSIALLTIIIFWSEGLVGLFELPGLAANILSYTRIAAAGVAGVIIAEIINSMLAPSPKLGWLNLLIFPIFMILHIANAALAMFEGMVQAGRLNIVEFLTKFYEGGGKAFKPFSLRLRHKIR